MKRLNDYFADEATDYLEQLDRLLAAPSAPDSHHVLRLTKGVRGSSLMAGADQLADLAGYLSRWAAEILDGSFDRAAERRELARHTVREMLTLARQLDDWSEQEAERTRAVAAMWDTSATTTEPAPHGAHPRRVVAIESLFYDDTGPHIIEPDPEVPGVAAPTVPIEQLLYRGQDALRAAIGLRAAVEESVRAGSPENVSDLLQEVFDLIELGLTAESAET